MQELQNTERVSNLKGVFPGLPTGGVIPTVIFFPPAQSCLTCA